MVAGLLLARLRQQAGLLRRGDPSPPSTCDVACTDATHPCLRPLSEPVIAACATLRHLTILHKRSVMHMLTGCYRLLMLNCSGLTATALAEPKLANGTIVLHASLGKRARTKQHVALCRRCTKTGTRSRHSKPRSHLLRSYMSTNARTTICQCLAGCTTQKQQRRPATAGGDETHTGL
jgi:hypothetical protein